MTTSAVDRLISAPWIIPVEPEGRVLSDHALVIDAGRIVDVLPATGARARYRALDDQHLPECILTAGLVNAHTHAAMTLLRGLADDMPLEQWLQGYVWPAEHRLVAPEFVRDGCDLAVAEMLLGGTTCFADMYFFPDACVAAARAAGIRVVFGIIVIEFASAWAGSAREYFDKGLAVLEDNADAPLVHAMLAPHAPYSVADAELREADRIAAQHGLKLMLHLHETRAETAGEERPFARLARLGLVNERLLAVHMTDVTAAEMQQLAGSGASVAHCPESNLKLASGLCPVAALQAAGVNVALGTDGAASNNDLDMLGEMRTAALLGKVVAGDPRALPAAGVLSMATINGARALGLGDETGSLLPGKSADLIALSTAGLHATPMFDPLSHLVYALGRGDVHSVWVAGEPRVQAGSLTGVDTVALRRRCQGWQARVRAAVAGG